MSRDIATTATQAIGALQSSCEVEEVWQIQVSSSGRICIYIASDGKTVSRVIDAHAAALSAFDLPEHTVAGMLMLLRHAEARERKE